MRDEDESTCNDVLVLVREDGQEVARMVAVRCVTQRAIFGTKYTHWTECRRHVLSVGREHRVRSSGKTSRKAKN